MGIWKVWNESILEQFDEKYELSVRFLDNMLRFDELLSLELIFEDSKKRNGIEM